jgi:hypothetical protein
MNRSRAAAALVILWLMGGCAHEPQPKVGLGRVSHVVICWLKEPNNLQGQRQIIRASEGFRMLPGVEDVVVGKALPSTRPVVDSSYDVSIVMIFRNQAALEAYESSPQHQDAVRDALRPNVRNFIVYDALERTVSSQPHETK